MLTFRVGGRSVTMPRIGEAAPAGAANTAPEPDHHVRTHAMAGSHDRAGAPEIHPVSENGGICGAPDAAPELRPALSDDEIILAGFEILEAICKAAAALDSLGRRLEGSPDDVTRTQERLSGAITEAEHECTRLIAARRPSMIAAAACQARVLAHLATLAGSSDWRDEVDLVTTHNLAAGLAGMAQGPKPLPG